MTPILSSDAVSMQSIATACFAVSILHSFFARPIGNLSERFRPHSVGSRAFHLLGEVELVFALWGAVLLMVWTARFGFGSARDYFLSVQFTEVLFVFSIMLISAAKPVLDLAARVLAAVARVFPFQGAIPSFLTILSIGPLLGSLITEPAAMTISALLLRRGFFHEGISTKLKLTTVGLLFVNVSIGGSLTHYAAPPVVMVAHTWLWDLRFMLEHFGWKAAIAVALNTILAALVFRKELGAMRRTENDSQAPSPAWLWAIHTVFVASVVYFSHSPQVFLSILAVFCAFVAITHVNQEKLELRSATLVGLFLGGLVVLGQLQSWWLRPILEGLGQTTLFLGATALTAVIDNAALTYLGSLTELGDAERYSLMAGALTGGGLTIIANAPNPLGYGILSPVFGHSGLSPIALFVASLPFTMIAAACFCFL